MTRRPTQSSRPRRSGFTLLEILIVLAIIIVIAAMVVPNLIGAQQGANEQATFATIKQAEAVAKRYAVDHGGAFAEGTGPEVWQEFVTPKPFRGKQIRPYYEEAPVDAWGNPLSYEWNDGTHSKSTNPLKPAIWSFGPNTQDDNGEGDDINNWTSAQTAQ